MTLSPQTKKFIEEHKNDDLSLLALQAHKFPEIDMPAAITQIIGRRTMKEKVPSWYEAEGLLYPRHLSLEQCSSEATAQYKTSILKGDSFIDLTGGFGIDCAFLSGSFRKGVYVEQQNELCEIARNNFPLLGLSHIEIKNEDSIGYLQRTEKVSSIFIDPARRDEHGGKIVSISDCEPNAKKLAPLMLSKADTVMIKLSPMLDLSLALNDMPDTNEVHVVSVANECKELLLLLNHNPQAEKKIYCVNIRKNGEIQSFSFTREQESETTCEYTSEIEEYLYEPNASILKAGAYKSIATRYKLKKLHPNSHLYTSEVEIENFPGRSFCCNSVFSLNKKEQKTYLGDLQKANITIRNFPSTVAELRKRIKLGDGGNDYLFATTLFNEKKVIIRCTKL